MPVPINRDASDIRLVTIASGNTQSSIIKVQGFSLASLTAPLGLKGHLQYRTALTDYDLTSGRFYRHGDDVSTGITQTLAAVTKPMNIAVRPEVLVCRAFKLAMTSAQTGHKVLHLRVMG